MKVPIGSAHSWPTRWKSRRSTGHRGRRLTKLYETVERGSLSELHERFSDRKLKGEFVIVVGGRLD